ncbi:MAG TPA: murein biosynthesis integral membrane protein MurJ [Candidatus Acidoferrales bacterium]|nr:murein biosynthesis integral membrane protein MurJ [Candidatus Acidoferrales bacterium]
MSETHQILRSTRVITFITLLSRVSGYIRDLVVALLLGTSLAADAFVIAFRIPNFLRRLMAEGAMTAAFIPVFTSHRAERTEAESWDFARRMFWSLTTVLAAVTVLGIIFAPQLVRLFTLASPEPEQWSLAVLLSRITFPYCLLVSLIALASAALNTIGKFGLPASVPIFLNLAIIGGGALAWHAGATQAAIALSVGVLVGGVIQLVVQLPPLLRRGMPLGFKLGFDHEGVRRVSRLMLPAVAGIGIYQVNVLVSTAIASQEPGWISALYYANRLTELAMGVYAISIATVVLPLMSRQAVARRLDQLHQTMTFSLCNVAFIMVPATVGLMVLSDPIVRVLFEHRAFSSASTELTSWALLFYAFGLPAFASVRLLVQGFYATEDTSTPVRVSIVAIVSNLILCFALVGPLKQGGLALATSLASYLHVMVLYVVYRRRLGALDESRLTISLLRTTAAAAGMGLLCWFLSRELGLMQVHAFGSLLARFTLVIVAGAASYLLLARLMRAHELTEVYTLITGRKHGASGFPGVQGVVPGAPPND